jgi:hypothetical protein
MDRRKKISLLFLLFFANNIAAQQWQVSSMPDCPKATSNNAVSANGNYIYTFGGIDSTKLYSGIHQQCFALNTTTLQWQALQDLPDTLGKIAAAASKVKDTIYIVGGYHVYANGNEKSSNKVHRFNTVTNTFMSDAATVPIAIDDQVQAVWRDSLIYVVTGWSNTTNVNNVQLYNPSTNIWSVGTNTPQLPDYKAFGASGVIVQDTIFYFGGAITNPNFPAVNVLRKGVINTAIPTLITWSSVKLLDIFGYRMGATVVGDYICWIGGSAVTYNYNGIAYNGTGAVPNLKRAVWYNYKTGNIIIDTANIFNMDLRGVADASDTVKYLIGGMQAAQKVSNTCVKLNVKNAPLYIKNLENEWTFTIAPNPASSVLKIASKKVFSNVNIVNAEGNVVRKITKNADTTIDINNLPAGMYYLQVQMDGQQIWKPFIKK